MAEEQISDWVLNQWRIHGLIHSVRLPCGHIVQHLSRETADVYVQCRGATVITAEPPQPVDDRKMLTVAEVIEILQEYPQDLPVTGYNGSENTDWVTRQGIKLEFDSPRLPNGEDCKTASIDIMGY